MKPIRLFAFASVLLIAGLLFFTQISLADSVDQEEELFMVAGKAFDDGFYDVALRYIEQFQQKFPDSKKKVQVKLLLGQCYFFKNQYLKAYDIFQSLIQYTEFRDATLFWLGETYFKGGDYKQAEKNYQQLINTYVNSSYMPQGLYSLGWTYFQQNRFEEARDTFQKLVKRYPNHPLSEESFFKMGECSHNAQDHDSAVKIFHDFVNTYPKSNRRLDADFLTAESYYAANNFLLAINFYAQAAQESTEPKITVLSRLGMGWSYLKLQKYDLAEKSFNEAGQYAKDHGIATDDVLLGLANLYLEAGDPQKSLDMYQHILKMEKLLSNQRIAEATLGVANNQYTLKQYPQAIQAYQAIINQFSNDPSLSELVEKAYYGLAWTYLKDGKVDFAIKNFQDIVNKSTGKVARMSALTQIGDAYQEINEFEKAITTYDQVLRESSENVYADYAQYRQAIALLKVNKLDAASLSFQSLQNNFPKSKYIAEVKYYLALIYFKKDQWDEAIKMTKAYLEEPRENKNFIPEGHYLQGLAFLNLKKYEQAINTFQKITKNFPESKSLVEESELSIAKSLVGMGKVKEGIEKFTNITKLYSGSDTAGDAFIWLGEHAYDDGDYPTAVKFFNEFLSTMPKNEKSPYVQLELGQSFQATGRLEDALNTYSQIKDNADQEIAAKAKLAIADIFSKEVDPQKAVATYRNIAVSMPEFKREALMRVASLYKNSKNYDKAISTYQEILDTVKNLSKAESAWVLFEIADTYELLHDATKAVDIYLKIPYLYAQEQEWVIKSYLRLARIFEDTAQWDQAETIYKKVTAYHTDESKYAQERLDWIAANASKESTKAQP